METQFEYKDFKIRTDEGIDKIERLYDKIYKMQDAKKDSKLTATVNVDGIEGLQEKLDNMKGEIKDAKIQNEGLSQEIEILTDKLESKTDECEKIMNLRKLAEEKVCKVEQDLEKANMELNKTQEENKNLQDRIEEMKKIISVRSNTELNIPPAPPVEASNNEKKEDVVIEQEVVKDDVEILTEATKKDFDPQDPKDINQLKTKLREAINPLPDTNKEEIKQPEIEPMPDFNKLYPQPTPTPAPVQETLTDVEIIDGHKVIRDTENFEICQIDEFVLESSEKFALKMGFATVKKLYENRRCIEDGKKVEEKLANGWE